MPPDKLIPLNRKLRPLISPAASQAARNAMFAVWKFIVQTAATCLRRGTVHNCG